MGLSSIELVSIPVTDQQSSKDFYVEKLGFTVVAEEVMGDGADAGRWVQLGAPGGGVTVSLVTWMPAMAPGSLHGLTMLTDDIAATVNELRGRGVTISEEPFDSPYGSFATVLDVDGNGINLHQPPAS